MFVVIISEEGIIEDYKECLEGLNLDLSNVLSPKDFSLNSSDIFKNYFLKRADVVLVMTKEDKFNFFISKLCKNFYETKRIITLINNSNNKEVFNSIGVLDVIDMKGYAREKLHKYLEEGEF